VVQEYVKAFFWSKSDTDGQPRLLYIQREEPSGTSTVLASPTMFEGRNYTVLIRGVEDFEVRDDFMFATKKADTVSICVICEKLWHHGLIDDFHHYTQTFQCKYLKAYQCDFVSR
jgi:hypothetical protein